MVVNLSVNKNTPPANVAVNLSKIPSPGELGVLTTPGKSQTVGSLGNAGIDPLENHKVTQPAYSVS